jgi:SAM-dependent methyltransferase
MSLHEVAAAGYLRSTDAYERGRPAYPAGAVDYLTRALGLHAEACLLDLGAGTGKLTQLLEPTGARLVAVEPVATMREKFAAKLPRATILEGTAESLPLDAGTVDAVTVAQAFHWFDGARAIEEIHRVLKPGGRLGLVWNVRDESVAWVGELTRLLDPHEGSAPRYRTGRWRDPFHTTRMFSPLASAVFTHVHACSPETVVDRVASVSFIAALPAAEHQDVLARVRRLLDRHPKTRGRASIALPYRTDVFIATRLDVTPVVAEMPRHVR